MSDGKNLGMFEGKTFLPAKKASLGMLGQIPVK